MSPVDQNIMRMITEVTKRVAEIERYVGITKPPEPQPAPVPKLVEAVENHISEYDKPCSCASHRESHEFICDGCGTVWLKTGTNSRATKKGMSTNEQAINKLRQALAAEKRRQELVGTCLEILREFAKTGRSDLWCNAELALKNLDAFDKERGA